MQEMRPLAVALGGSSGFNGERPRVQNLTGLKSRYQIVIQADMG